MPAADVFAPLKEAQCRLMPKDAIDRYNQLAAAFVKVRAKIPPKLAGDITEEFTRTWTKLTRRYYQVGFVGRNQVGKSTLLNRMLGVWDEENRVAHEGGGESTTSAITRVRRQAAPGGANELYLRFQSQKEFEDKKLGMCRTLALDPALSVEQLLATLAVNRPVTRGEKPPLPEDPRYFRKLLLSYQEYGRMLGSERFKGDWQQRTTWLNHDSEDMGPSKALLLAEAEAYSIAPYLVDDLELIDLPGVGAQRSVDTILTSAFVKDLDGALCVVRANLLSDEAFEKVVLQLKHEAFEGETNRRIWLVCTYFDGLGNNYFAPQRANTSIFHNINRLAMRIFGGTPPPEQICFFSRRVFDRAQQNGGSVPREASANIVDVTADAQGPPALAEHPHLRDAFESVLADGGIGRLRTLLSKELVGHVRARVHDWLERQFKLLKGMVEQAEQFANSQNKAELLQKLSKCNEAVFNQLQIVERGPPSFAALQTEFQQQLDECLNVRLPDQEYVHNYNAEQVRGIYPDLANELDAELQERFKSHIVPSAYRTVGKAFDDGVPPILIAGANSLAAAWNTYLAEDQRRVAEWQGQWFPSFIVPDLFEQLEQAEEYAFDGRSFRDFMLRLVDVNTQHAVHVLRMQVRKRLLELKNLLFAYRMTAPAAPAAPAAPGR